MKRFISLLFCSLCTIYATAQSIAGRLENAYTIFESDSQLKTAIASLYVIDAATGKVLFEKNAGTGLAPASTQKIITAATAFDILGKGFRYRTEYGVETIDTGRRNMKRIYIRASGDPTLGSWRWGATHEDRVLEEMVAALKKEGIRAYADINIIKNGWDGETVPDGWIWQDIGNYYGAGAGAFNWRENQYDIHLQSGLALGDPVQVTGTKPVLHQYGLRSEVRSAAKSTGDNAYIYFSKSGREEMIIRGTIPLGENKFTISGAMPDPEVQFVGTLAELLKKSGTAMELNVQKDNSRIHKIPPAKDGRTVGVILSPTLDSMSYWFLRRSINLYGEAFLKTLAQQQGKTASASNGISIVKAHWKERGIDGASLHMVDGSGLSPLNRVTTKAQVDILAYAKKQDWFTGYFHGFPEFNGMKMKSGTISGAKGFCGYHRSREGKEYIFSFIVNNYNGSSSALVQKMYRVLNELK